MIWHYFPIGMRFPVTDFSDETKRACWNVALSAAFASDACGTTLYEAMEPLDPGSFGAVYTCIVCYVGIKQSRLAGKTMHSLDGLKTRLCLNDPLVQANYLEHFGPYSLLGEIGETGLITATDAGSAFLPTGEIRPMHRNDGRELLIACDTETQSRELGYAAEENGFRVQRVLLADGGKGTVRALVSGTKGRYDAVSVVDAEGSRYSGVIGVIPGKTAVLEAPHCDDGRPAASLADLVRGVLDLGYRSFLIGTDAPQDRFERADPGSDPRLNRCAIAYPDAEWILDRIDFAAKARTADCVIVCSERSGAVDAVLSRLTDLGRACCLISGSVADGDETNLAYPSLRGIVHPSDPGAPLADLFRSEVLPLIGEPVAKTGEL